MDSRDDGPGIAVGRRGGLTIALTWLVVLVLSILIFGAMAVSAIV